MDENPSKMKPSENESEIKFKYIFLLSLFKMSIFCWLVEAAAEVKQPRPPSNQQNLYPLSNLLAPVLIFF